MPEPPHQRFESTSEVSYIIEIRAIGTWINHLIITLIFVIIPALLAYFLLVLPLVLLPPLILLSEFFSRATQVVLQGLRSARRSG